MKKSPFVSILSCLLCLCLLAGCSKKSAPTFTPSTQPDPPASETVPVTEAPAQAETVSAESLFSGRDLEGAADLSKAVFVQLNSTSASCDSNAVAISGSTVTIQKEGVYCFSGQLTDGQILVDAGKTDKVQLVLNGAEITSQTSAAIYVKKADKVFLTLADGTENKAANGGSYVAIDDNSIDAAIFSKADLTLNGSGSLTVEAAAGHGIVSKDELVITGGSYTIQSAAHGMTGKDCISIADGSFRITSMEDGIHAKNSDGAALGGLYIGGGSFLISAGQDGISATGTLQIAGGSFEITSGGGCEAVEMRPSDGAGWGERSGATFYGSTESLKGIKSDGAMVIQGGTFFLDCGDDGLHTGGSLTVSGGEFTIFTADDGMHADGDVFIQGGSIQIPYCYEGIEGENVTVSGGTIDIEAFDDGINAAGGMDGSGFGPQMEDQPAPDGQQPAPGGQQPGRQDSGFPGGQKGGRGRDRFSGGGNNQISVSGGSITIVSDGDCLDSNGSISLSGGTLDLTCGGFGNTAIDCDGSFENTGADVTTNDGSENGGGFGGHRMR